MTHLSCLMDSNTNCEIQYQGDPHISVLRLGASHQHHDPTYCTTSTSSRVSQGTATVSTHRNKVDPQLGNLSSCQDTAYPDTEDLHANAVRPIKRCYWLSSIPTMVRSLHPTFCTYTAMLSFLLKVLFSTGKTSALFVCDSLRA
jgi:hypothetical protein